MPRLRRAGTYLGLAAAAVLLVSACSASASGNGTTGKTSSSPNTSSSSSSTPAAPTSSSSAPVVTKPVHVSLKLSDGAQVGVGMPIIAFFSRPITNAKAFAAATKVTVNDKPVIGAWYCEQYTSKATPIECDWRMETYWPAHAQIHMDLPVKGVSAGTGLAFDDDLTSSFSTGPANIVTVNAFTHKLTVVSDGVTWGSFPVSLGASSTRTRHGIKIIMEKLPTVCMHDTNHTYYECGIKDDQRLTYDGEYLHAAPWNTYNIDHGIDSSNGCTNLHPADALKLYGFLEIGDVVNYPNATGAHMAMGDGYGDWNVPWGQWQTGGLYAMS